MCVGGKLARYDLILGIHPHKSIVQFRSITHHYTRVGNLATHFNITLKRCRVREIHPQGPKTAKNRFRPKIGQNDAAAVFGQRVTSEWEFTRANPLCNSDVSRMTRPVLVTLPSTSISHWRRHSHAKSTTRPKISQKAKNRQKWCCCCKNACVCPHNGNAPGKSHVRIQMYHWWLKQHNQPFHQFQYQRSTICRQHFSTKNIDQNFAPKYRSFFARKKSPLKGMTSFLKGVTSFLKGMTSIAHQYRGFFCFPLRFLRKICAAKYFERKSLTKSLNMLVFYRFPIGFLRKYRKKISLIFRSIFFVDIFGKIFWSIFFSKYFGRYFL